MPRPSGAEGVSHDEAPSPARRGLDPLDLPARRLRGMDAAAVAPLAVEVGRDRVKAPSGLAPQLSVPLLLRALDDAIAIAHASGHTWAVGALVPHLTALPRDILIFKWPETLHRPGRCRCSTATWWWR